ncbi:MAG: hypothetical protein GY810_10210 [Aureispira sp.]|nr:hypothetical protein [Aureispira sp.]
MKTFLKVIGWICVVGWIFIGYDIFNYYKITEGDIEKVSGVLSKDPDYSKDVDGKKTKMHFYLEGKKKHFTVPGLLLLKAPDKIEDFRKGDQVDLYLKKERGEEYILHNLILSVAKKEQKPLIDIQEAIHFYASPKYLFIAIFFWLMSLVLAWWLVRPRKVKISNLNSDR